MKPVIISTKNLKLKQYALWLGVTALVTSILWITIEIIAAYGTTTIDGDITALTEPLNPDLDEEILTQINQRPSLPENFQINANNPASASADSNQN